MSEETTEARGRAGEAVDIVVVGGGPAGVSTLLALQACDPSLAARAVILEKGTYPREKYCAGAFGGRGERILAGWGVRPAVPSVEIRGFSMRTGGCERSSLARESIGRVVRRFEFDEALVREAQSRGIRVLEGARVDDVRRSDDGSGATVTSARGVFHARIVVGADGVGSVVRKCMGVAPGALRAQVLELDTESVPSDRDRRLLHFDATERDFTGYYWDFPTVVDGRPMVCRGAYHLRLFDDDAIDLGERLGRRLRALGLDLDRYKNKRFAERGFEPASRVVDGPFMLVGEAAGVDPVTGEGIAQGVEYGSLAGPFVRGVLRGARPLADWTRVLERSRLGRDLAIRRLLVHGFYGPHRPAIEAMLAASDDLLEAGCVHFGGLPFEAPPVLKGSAIGGALFLKNLLRPEPTGPRATKPRAFIAPPANPA